MSIAWRKTDGKSWKRYRHVKSGGTYKVLVADAKLQTAYCAEGDSLEDMDRMVVYMSEKDESIWVRSHKEFMDGRFVEIVK